LVEELITLSPKLTASYFDLHKDKEIAEEYHVDKTPGIVLAAREGDKLTDYGIRFAGIPSGHAFTSLVNDLLMVSSRSSGLNEDTLAFLQDLEEDVILQVFSTPT
jgi:alkyl hydroperoxide reductase subunit AhpF